MAKQTWIKDNGVWKKVKSAWVNVNGVWKKDVMPKGIVSGGYKEFMSYYNVPIIIAYRHVDDITKQSIMRIDERGNTIWNRFVSSGSSSRTDEIVLNLSPDEKSILVVTRTDEILKFDTETGDEIFKRTLPSNVSYNYPKYSYWDTFDERLYLTTDFPTIYGFNNKGSALWGDFETIRDGGYYDAVAGDGLIYSYSKRYGGFFKMAVSANANGYSIVSAKTISEARFVNFRFKVGRKVIGFNNDGVYCIEGSNLNLEWSYKLISTKDVFYNERNKEVIVQSGANQIVVLTLNGKLKNKYVLSQDAKITSIDQEGFLYGALESNRLCKFSIEGKLIYLYDVGNLILKTATKSLKYINEE